MVKHIIHQYIEKNGINFASDDLKNGEIGVNTLKECFYIKNNDGNIVSIGDKQLINISYLELRNIIDSNSLIPGHFYRIIDYVTKTTQLYTRSANHLFDIIVLALSKNELNKEALAIEREGETYFKNNGCELNKWRIWYNLINDGTYTWVDKNCTGVIYRMIDEYGNECPYDFKNIQYLKTDSTDNEEYVYTFSEKNENGYTDLSLKGDVCYNNIIKEYKNLK